MATRSSLPSHSQTITLKSGKLHLSTAFTIWAYADAFTICSAYNISNDSNNNWRVEILRGSENDPQSKGRIRSLRTMFRLIHVNMQCALYTRDKQLPAWGSKQQEVTCMRDAKKNQYSTFFVESSVDSRCKSCQLICMRWWRLATSLFYIY